VTLFKILQEFLLPSVFILVLILAGLTLLFRQGKQKIGKKLIVLGVIFYYIFSITPVADLILLPLESQYSLLKQDELDRADKIVLLLGRGETNVLRASEILRLYNQQSEVIISGTSILNQERNVAEEVKEYLLQRGIFPEDIILENKSRNTAESAKNIKEIVSREPFFLVTSAYHMPRSIEAFQKMGTNPIPAPTDFKIERDYNILDFFPNPNNLEKSDLAFHEYFGILFYRLWY